MNQLLPHIGTIELVSLPDDGIQGVAAKIDTGADNSAIWASNIHIDDGQLVFNFFAPGSMFYREESVATTAFRTTTVKNSFGHKEFRYKIKLRIKIGNRTIRRWFTLADRSRNNYPILLGKNFLKNRFIVDVSQKHLVGEQPGANKILIFTNNPTENNEFFKSVAKYNKSSVEYESTDYDSLRFCINGDGTRVVNTASDEDIANYSFVYFKNHKNRELSASAAEYLHYKNRPFADQEFLQYMSASKLSEYIRLSNFGISVPLTICMSTRLLRDSYDELIAKLGEQFVLKEIRSDKGKYNYLIRSKRDFSQAFKLAEEDHVYCAQQYVPNDGFYRIYVMGKEVSLAIWRSTTPHKQRLKAHLNKPRGGINATNVPLDKVPAEARDLALRAANCMNRQVAGVDLVQDNTNGNWYVLEANNDPQIRSGAFVEAKAEMVAKYFEKELNQ